MRSRPAAVVAADGPGSESFERELVRRGRTGDSEALGELLRTYQARVFGFVRRYVGRRDEAAEIVQEAFLQAFKSIDRFEEGRPFRPWLFKIAVNVCRNHRRLGQRRELPQEVLPDASALWQEHPAVAPDAALFTHASAAELEGWLATLTAEDRALLLLRYSEEMSYQDLATLYSRPQGLLKMRVHRAIGRLRALAMGEAR